MPEEQQRQLYEILDDYRDIITDRLKGLAKIELVQLVTPCPYPMPQKCYQVPEDKVNQVKSEIQLLEEQGIICKSSSPWNSPVVLVKKPNGQLRLWPLK